MKQRKKHTKKKFKFQKSDKTVLDFSQPRCKRNKQIYTLTHTPTHIYSFALYVIRFY